MRAACPHPLFYRPSNIRWAAQRRKSHLHPLHISVSQHPILEHPQPVFFPVKLHTHTVYCIYQASHPYCILYISNFTPILYTVYIKLHTHTVYCIYGKIAGFVFWAFRWRCIRLEDRRYQVLKLVPVATLVVCTAALTAAVCTAILAGCSVTQHN